MKVVLVLVLVGLLITGLTLISCGSECDHCCKCDCGSHDMSFSDQDCLDCEDACTNGFDVPFIGHIDGCGEDLVSFEAFADRDACE